MTDILCDTAGKSDAENKAQAQGARYEIRTGKYGQYFYDLVLKENMGLQDVLDVLHSNRELLASYGAVVRNKDYFHGRCLELEKELSDLRRLMPGVEE